MPSQDNSMRKKKKVCSELDLKRRTSNSRSKESSSEKLPAPVENFKHHETKNTFTLCESSYKTLLQRNHSPFAPHVYAPLEN